MSQAEINKKELSEKEKLILDEIENDVEGIQGKFIKFKDQERKVLYFDVEKTKRIYSKYNNETKEYKESDKPVPDDDKYKYTVKYYVYDPNKPDQEMEWTVTNTKLMQDIGFNLRKSKILSIKRLGENKNTVYSIDPA